jgi:hypothetical protein
MRGVGHAAPLLGVALIKPQGASLGANIFASNRSRVKEFPAQVPP